VELQFHVLRVQLSPCGIQTYIAYILNNFGSCARVMWCNVVLCSVGTLLGSKVPWLGIEPRVARSH